MGNVQSEAPADAGLAAGRDREGKRGLTHSCLAGALHGTGTLPPQPEAPAAQTCLALGSELPCELGKHCSTKAKLALPPTWAQSSSSARRCSNPARAPREAGKGTEPQPAQGEPPAGLQHPPPEQEELSPRKAVPKGKSKGEPVSGPRPGGQGDLLGKSTAAPAPQKQAQGPSLPEGLMHPQGRSPQPPAKAQSLAPGGPNLPDVPHAQDQGRPCAAAPSPARAAPPRPPPTRGVKAAPLSHEEGSWGGTKAPASPRPMPSSQAWPQPSPAREAPSGPEGRANSEGVQALLEHGLSFLYKVTIQPGQHPPSITAIKHRASLISSGISYADALKQGPQPAPGSSPGPPLLPSNLPLLRELDRREQEELDSFTQAFLDQFQKMGTKEPPPATGQAKQQLHLVKILDDLTAFSLRGPEGPKPRAPTPYPQRRKGQGRSSPQPGSNTAPLSSPKLGRGRLQLHRAGLPEDTNGEPLPLGPAPLAELEQCQQAAKQVHGPAINPPTRAGLLSSLATPALPPGHSHPGPEDKAMALPGQEALPPSPVATRPEEPCSGASLAHTALAQGGTAKETSSHTKLKARKLARATGQRQPPPSPSPSPQEKLKAHGQLKAKAAKGQPQPQEPPAMACEQGAASSPQQPQAPAHHWPPFQLTESCPCKCYCRHQEQRQLPRNISAWLTPAANHLAEPPWVSTAILAGSLVAGTRFFLDSYEQHAGDDD